ncbi:MAG: transposon-encoded TnpW family protein [Clostridiales bacterium]|nr:transposon-encoded TnpW family protein [Clostridiales bacterium]
MKGKTTYEVSLFFNKNSKVTLEEKLKRLIRQDVKNEDF